MEISTLAVVAGTAMTLGGVAILVWCMLRARRLQGEEQAEAGIQSELQKLVALNMGGVFLGFVGLGVVAVGVLIA